MRNSAKCGIEVSPSETKRRRDEVRDGSVKVIDGNEGLTQVNQEM